MSYPYPNDQPPPPQGMPGQGMPTGPTPYPPPYPAPAAPGYGYPPPTGPMNYPAPVPGAPNPWAQATPVMAYQVTDRVEKSVSQLPLISMIIGIVSIPLLCSSIVTDGLPILTGIAGVAAVALGHIGLAQVPRAGQSRGNGLAITGLILGYLMLATVLVWLMIRYYYRIQVG